MTCPVAIGELLSHGEGDVEVRLTPKGDRLLIDRAAAERQDFVAWALRKLDVEPLREFKPYTLVAGVLGLEQRDTLIVMAAISVGAPDRIEIAAYPIGMPTDLDESNIMHGIVSAVTSRGLECGMWPLLKCVAA